MKRIRVEHIPSGKEWIGKWREEPIVATVSLVNLDDNCTILIITDRGEVAIPANIWNESVRTIESKQDETN